MLHRDVKYIEADNPTFEVGYNPQTEWKWLITLAFFCGELGAGVFLVSLFVPAAAAKLAFFAALLGWLIVAGPKNLFHFIYLGKPWRFWRGLSRPGSVLDYPRVLRDVFSVRIRLSVPGDVL